MHVACVIIFSAVWSLPVPSPVVCASTVWLCFLTVSVCAISGCSMMVSAVICLKCLLDIEKVEEEGKTMSVLTRLANQISNSTIAIHGVGDSQVKSGELERHKEDKDRDCVRTALLPHNEDDNSTDLTKCYSDELIFQLPKGRKGFHGSIDMMAGLVTCQIKEEELLSGIIVPNLDKKSVIPTPHYFETKSASGVPLVGQKVKKMQPLSQPASGSS